MALKLGEAVFVKSEIILLTCKAHISIHSSINIISRRLPHAESCQRISEDVLRRRCRLPRNRGARTPLCPPFRTRVSHRGLHALGSSRAPQPTRCDSPPARLKDNAMNKTPRTPETMSVADRRDDWFENVMQKIGRASCRERV